MVVSPLEKARGLEQGPHEAPNEQMLEQSGWASEPSTAEKFVHCWRRQLSGDTCRDIRALTRDMRGLSRVISTPKSEREAPKLRPTQDAT